MFNSLNLQIAMLNSGIDAEIVWQWDGGHIPSEVLGDSFSLYVNQMYREYVDGVAAITKAVTQPQTANCTATQAAGTEEQDARHWDLILLDIFEAYSDLLAPCSIAGR